eukprot:Rhum_TRINITY_DN14924_c30_g1::Rhum_TRINITY_DN14924_c30_g1_i1::g.129208::m.129208
MLLVLVPDLIAVLRTADVVIASGPVDEQDREVDRVEVCDNRAEAGGERPAETVEPVSGVVDLAGHAPPAGDQQLLVRVVCGHRLQVRHRRAVRVAPERILLRVGQAEHTEAQQVEEDENEGRHLRGEVRVVVHQVPCLQCVRERHPRKVAEAQHVAETVAGHVHRRQDGALLVERVPDVQALAEHNQVHRQGVVAQHLLLLDHHAEVDDHPSDHARAQLAEDLQVEAADARVQLAADEEVVHGVAADALSQLLALAERRHKECDGEQHGERDGSHSQLQVVVVQVRQVEADDGDGDRHPERQVPVQLVLKVVRAHHTRLRGRQLHTLHGLARQHTLQHDKEEEPAKAHSEGLRLDQRVQVGDCDVGDAAQVGALHLQVLAACEEEEGDDAGQADHRREGAHGASELIVGSLAHLCCILEMPPMKYRYCS